MLDEVDLSLTLPKRAAKQAIAAQMDRLYELQRAVFDRKLPVIILFEGWDAAGKGTVIRALTERLDPRGFKVLSTQAPRTHEQQKPWLWRFWMEIPRRGQIAIFDRSWYGRVLVERVERFASPEQWQRAFSEINDFEEQIVQHGWGLEKFWLHISPDEQLRRFEARKETSYKHFKITPEDYRNRERRNEYEAAANEMIERTSTPCAPWHLIAAEDKHFARIEVLRIVCEGLEKTLEA